MHEGTPLRGATLFPEGSFMHVESLLYEYFVLQETKDNKKYKCKINNKKSELNYRLKNKIIDREVGLGVKVIIKRKKIKIKST